jgi:hypothetical protein
MRFEAYNVFNHTEFSTNGTAMQMQGGSQVNAKGAVHGHIVAPTDVYHSA